MMSYINETDFVIENKKLVYPEIVADGLQLYYDAKGKRDTDYHRDTMLDMSGNKNHGKLYNFAYEKHSGYKDGLVFDYIDDKLVRPTLNLKPDDFTFMLNGNIISFSPDGTVKRVQDGEVIKSKGFNLVRNGDFNLTNHVEWASNTNIEHVIKNNEVTIIGKGSPRTTGGNWFTFNKINTPYSDSIFYITALAKGQGQAYIAVSYNTTNLYLNDSFSRVSYFGKHETNNSTSGYAVLGGTIDDEITFKEVMAINLTETFGAGNEPTKEEMDEIINRFGFISNSQDLIDRIEYKGNDLGDMENIIDGLYKTEVLTGEEIYTDKADDNAGVHAEVDGKSYQHAGSGKNLFNKRMLSDRSKFQLATYSSSPVIQLKPNTAYVLSASRVNPSPDGNQLVLNVMDATGGVPIYGSQDYNSKRIRSLFNMLPNHVGFNNFTNTFTTTESGLIFFSYYDNHNGKSPEGNWFTDVMIDAQLEEGSTATAYEPPAPTPDYPIEIYSLNDFDVVSSVGRENLLSDSVLTHFSRPYIKEGDIYRIDTLTNEIVGSYSAGIKINASIFTIGKTYTLSFKTRKIKGNVNDIAGHAHGFVSQRVFIDGKYTSNSWSSKTDYPNDELVHEFVVTLDFTGGSGDRNLYIQPNRISGYSSAYILDIWDLKVEEGLGTPYSSPLSESIQGSNTVDKINLLLDEPLRSVGDVKDRLFRDSDGVWKVERNTSEAEILSVSLLYNAGTTETFTTFIFMPPKPSIGYQTSRCSHFINSSGQWDKPTFTHYSDHTSVNNRYFMVENKVLGVDSSDSHSIRLNKINNWLSNESSKGTPVTLVYKVGKPYIETLDQELQDKLNNLRSFEDSNYVYTVLPNEDNYLSDNLKPTLHAKFLYNNWYKEDRVINNLMIYNRALTNEEMLQNYKTIKRRWGM